MKNYNILYGCNDGYAPFAGVSICSVLENNKDADSIHVYVMSDGISEENKKLLKRQVERYGSSRQIHITECNEIIGEIKNYGVTDYRGSYAAYLRLAFEKIISPTVEKLLYLDCDTLVIGSLAEMFELDLGENYMGVVSEALADSVKPLIDFGKDETYFNSGVILFNVPVWKREGCTKRLFTMMKDKDIKNPTGSDQDYLNYIARDKKVVMSPRFNLQPVHIAFSIRLYRRCYSSDAYYDDQTLQYSINNPVILHTYRFLGMFPWHRNSKHPCAEQFQKYKKLSEWREQEDIRKKLPLYLKIERVLYTVLPKGCFLKIFAMFHRKVARKTTMNF